MHTGELQKAKAASEHGVRCIFFAPATQII